MLSSSRGCGGRDLSLPSCLPSATLKSGELLAKLVFWTLFPFLHFGRQDGFFSVYLEERVFSFWVFSKYSFHGRRELLPWKEEAREVFSFRRPTSIAASWFFLDVNLTFLSISFLNNALAVLIIWVMAVFSFSPSRAKLPWILEVRDEIGIFIILVGRIRNSL